MALLIDSEMPADTGVMVHNQSSVTFSFTNTAGTFIQMCAVGGLVTNTDTITSMTYNGVEADRKDAYRDPGNGVNYGTIGTLANPATGANNVVVTFNTTMNGFSFGCLSFTGQHASAPVGDIQTNSGFAGGSHTVTVSSASGNIVSGLYGDGCGVASVNGAISWRTTDDCSGSLYTGACDTYSGAASVVAGFTDVGADNWWVMGMDIVAAAGGAAAGKRPQSRPFPYTPGSPPGLI